jgi:hypothetical protein
MVFPDISSFDDNSKHFIHEGRNKYLQATVFQRFLAVIMDYFILSPVVSFLCVLLFSQGLKLYRQFPDSIEAQVVLFQLVAAFVFLFTFIQALFIFISSGTPGQIFTKTYVEFELGFHPRYSLYIFFQAWFRQLGFMFSIVLLGMPFLAVFYHKQSRTVYEHMTESIVLTKTSDPLGFSIWGKDERRYVSVFMTTFLLFTISLSVLSFFNFYQRTLTSNLTHEQLSEDGHFCKEMNSIQFKNRLNVAAAMNLVGLLSDRCLDLEADFVLWRNFKSDVNSESESMAYFAKYLTAETDQDEQSYLQKTCQSGHKSSGCRYAQNFENGNYEQFLTELKFEKSNVLTDVLTYEFSKHLNLNIASAFDQIDKYSTFKLMNKYLLSEQMIQLGDNQKNRFPASSTDQKNSAVQIEKIQKRIDAL